MVRIAGRLAAQLLGIDLPDAEGLLFVYGRESRIDTSIHMLFMFFAIATVWLDKDGRVVDKVLAKPWRPSYIPKRPAKFILETDPALLARVSIGDQLQFEPIHA